MYRMTLMLLCSLILGAFPVDGRAEEKSALVKQLGSRPPKAGKAPAPLPKGRDPIGEIIARGPGSEMAARGIRRLVAI